MNKFFWLILLASIMTTAAVAVFLTLYLEPFQKAPLFVNTTPNASVPINTIVSNDKMQVRLYFLTADHQQLAIENREIASTPVIKTKVETALQAWMEGPKESGLILPMPSGTQLKGVFWSESSKTMYINFSEALIQNAPGHTLAEWATIYGIVNTVVDLSPLIEQVQIVVNNQPVSDDYTVWDWSMPFKPNDTFVRK